jgi:sodium pump decarboxylase gamma subunit
MKKRILVMGMALLTMMLAGCSGELMARAALNTVMGMAVVFAVLIIIYAAIECFRIFPYLEKKKKEKAQAQSQAAAKPIESRTQQAGGQAQAAQAAPNEDLQLAAVIAAAVAAYTGTSTDDFVVRSIRRRRP